ncbi:MAG: hypothetical protein ACXV3F_15315 [Frankiaceae bacterium]
MILIIRPARLVYQAARLSGLPHQLFLVGVALITLVRRGDTTAQMADVPAAVHGVEVYGT